MQGLHLGLHTAQLPMRIASEAPNRGQAAGSNDSSQAIGCRRSSRDPRR